MTIAKTGFAPAIKDFINEVIRHRIVFANQLMTIFALPRTSIYIFSLFEYHKYLPFDKIL